MTGTYIRKPVVAGSFYPQDANSISEQIRSFQPQNDDKFDAIAALLPHAGYQYSGRVAVTTANKLNLKDTIILLGPNHTGRGESASIVTNGKWQTPLGEIEIDSLFAGCLRERCAFLKNDTHAHAYEHSLEVELPILQYFKSDFKIVPIVFMIDDFSVLVEVGNCLAQVIQDLRRKDSVLIIASSDMTHYESYEEAAKKDNLAIQEILELNASGLIKKIFQYNISMCGWMPTVVMLTAAKKLGATGGRLILYETSAAVTQDYGSVVGYAGIIIN